MPSFSTQNIEVSPVANDQVEASLDGRTYQQYLLNRGVSIGDSDRLRLLIERHDDFDLGAFQVRVENEVEQPTIIFTPRCAVLSPEGQAQLLRNLTERFIYFAENPRRFFNAGRSAKIGHIAAAAAVAAYGGWEFYQRSKLGVDLPLATELTMAASCITSTALVGGTIGYYLDELTYPEVSPYERRSRKAEKKQAKSLPTGVLEIVSKVEHPIVTEVIA